MKPSKRALYELLKEAVGRIIPNINTENVNTGWLFREVIKVVYTDEELGNRMGEIQSKYKVRSQTFADALHRALRHYGVKVSPDEIYAQFYVDGKRLQYNELVKRILGTKKGKARKKESGKIVKKQRNPKPQPQAPRLDPTSVLGPYPREKSEAVLRILESGAYKKLDRRLLLEVVKHWVPRSLLDKRWTVSIYIDLAKILEKTGIDPTNPDPVKIHAFAFDIIKLEGKKNLIPRMKELLSQIVENRYKDIINRILADLGYRYMMPAELADYIHKHGLHRYLTDDEIEVIARYGLGYEGKNRTGNKAIKTLRVLVQAKRIKEKTGKRSSLLRILEMIIPKRDREIIEDMEILYKKKKNQEKRRRRHIKA